MSNKIYTNEQVHKIIRKASMISRAIYSIGNNDIIEIDDKTKLVFISIDDDKKECFEVENKNEYITIHKNNDIIILIPDNVIRLNPNFSEANDINGKRYIDKIRVIGGKNLAAINGMFYAAQAKEIDISELNLSNVKNMLHMFYNCVCKKINFGNVDTSSITNMNIAFAYSNIDEIDLSRLNLRKVRQACSTFENSNIKKLNFGDQIFPNIWTIDGMFRGSHIDYMSPLEIFGRIVHANGLFDSAKIPDIKIKLNLAECEEMESMFRYLTTDNLSIEEFTKYKKYLTNGVNTKDIFYHINASNVNIKSNRLLKLYNNYLNENKSST